MRELAPYGRDVGRLAAVFAMVALGEAALRRVHPPRPYAAINPRLFEPGAGGAFREGPEGPTPDWVAAAQQRAPFRSALAAMTGLLWSAALAWVIVRAVVPNLRAEGGGLTALGTTVLLWLGLSVRSGEPTARGALDVRPHPDGPLFSANGLRLGRVALGAWVACVAAVFALSRWRGELWALAGQWAALACSMAFLLGAPRAIGRRLGLPTPRAEALHRRVRAAFARAGQGAVDVALGEMPAQPAGIAPDGALLVDAVFASEARDDELDALARQLAPEAAVARPWRRRAVVALTSFFAAVALMQHAAEWQAPWCSLLAGVAMIAAGVVFVASVRAARRGASSALREGVEGAVWARVMLRHAAWNQRPLVVAPEAGPQNLYDALEKLGAKPPFARPKAPPDGGGEGMLAGTVIAGAAAVLWGLTGW